tara:strand:- start:11261 stop:11545 length:285 start_codon:yes stop_codon:yes gene_type:complete
MDTNPAYDKIDVMLSKIQEDRETRWKKFKDNMELTPDGNKIVELVEAARVEAERLSNARVQFLIYGERPPIGEPPPFGVEQSLIINFEPRAKSK